MHIINLLTSPAAWTSAPRYFTAWNILLLVLSRWVCPYVDVLLTSLVVVCISLWFVHIHPRKMTIVTGEELKGWDLVVADILFHIVPLLIAIRIYKRPTSPIPIAVAMCIFLFYLSFVNVEKVYGISKHVALSMFVVAMMIYTTVFLSKPV